jgi:hypothetical protein
METTQRASARPEWSDRPSVSGASPVEASSNATPRLDEDADTLLAEVVRLLDAAETVTASALLDGDHDSVVGAAAHFIACSRRARHLLSTAVHLDLTRVAS